MKCSSDSFLVRCGQQPKKAHWIQQPNHHFGEQPLRL